MKIKTCYTCNNTKPHSDFAVNNSKKDKLSSQCKLCQREYFKKHYSNKRKYYINRSRQQKQRSKLWMNKYKNNLACEICGENHPATLDFHHIKQTSKDFSVATGISKGYSIKKLQEEISKCQVLCSNCHRKLHYKNGASTRIRT